MRLMLALAYLTGHSEFQCFVKVKKQTKFTTKLSLIGSRRRVIKFWDFQKHHEWSPEKLYLKVKLENQDNFTKSIATN